MIVSGGKFVYPQISMWISSNNPAALDLLGLLGSFVNLAKDK